MLVDFFFGKIIKIEVKQHMEHHKVALPLNKADIVPGQNHLHHINEEFYGQKQSMVVKEQMKCRNLREIPVWISYDVSTIPKTSEHHNQVKISTVKSLCAPLYSVFIYLT